MRLPWKRRAPSEIERAYQQVDARREAERPADDGVLFVQRVVKVYEGVAGRRDNVTFSGGGMATPHTYVSLDGWPFDWIPAEGTPAVVELRIRKP